jgi:hypothetical protein
MNLIHKQTILLVGLFTLSFVTFATQPKPVKKINQPVYSSFIFQMPDGTFGYDIFKDNKQIICQETVPGRKGKSGFKTYDDAKKVSELVIGKLKEGLLNAEILESDLYTLSVQ